MAQGLGFNLGALIPRGSEESVFEELVKFSAAGNCKTVTAW
jgi:hypothetical protein